MKRLLITLLLAVLSTSAMAEWILMGESKDFTNYADFSTIKKAGDKVKMWTMQDYKTMQIEEMATILKFLSMKVQKEYDCQNETVSVLAYFWYSSNMGEGQTVLFSTKRSDSGTSPVVPGTIWQAEWKIACGKR